MDFDFSGLHLERVLQVDKIAEAETGWAAGTEHVAQVAAERTPVETGRLVGSQDVHRGHGAGDGVIGNSITYDGPYARYQHERLDLRHEHGSAKYLELPMLEEGETALGIAARAMKGAS